MTITITEREWEEKYVPYFENGEEVNVCACWDKGEIEKMENIAKKLAVSFGMKEEDYPLFVWTMVDGDDDALIISNGLHFVNRINWLFTEKPWAESLDAGKSVFVDVEVDLG